jgi:zinc transporter ZupT
MSVFAVFWFALVTALATGLGALPFAAFRHISPRWIGVSGAVAAGLMGGASTGLVYQGLNDSLSGTMLGVVIGLGFILVSHRLVEGRQAPVASLSGNDAAKALLIVGVMTLHSFTEGVGVGVSFGGGRELGLFITTAIAVHNIPEGLAISLVMVPRGTPVWKAAAWSVFSSLPQPLMAVPAFLFVEHFQAVLPVGLGFAAGAMIWMIFAEILPDALEQAPPDIVAAIVTLSFAAMVAFQSLIGGLGP